MANQRGRPDEVRVTRPPNHLVRAVVLSLLLVPLGLLIAASKSVETLTLLYGPPFRSETPLWMSALMAIMAGVAALMGIFMPVAALAKSLQVNDKFNAGDFAGAQAASRRSAHYSRQSIIFLIALSLIIFTDIFRYATA
jgi:hypothetical protein